MEAGRGSYQRLPDEGRTPRSTLGRRCAKGYGLALLVLALAVTVLQQALFSWATMGCKASELVDYSFPGGGSYDLVEGSTLLIEQTPYTLSSSFLVQPTDEVGLATEASTGIWYRTWGPLFWTYVHKDNLGHATFWARDRPLALGASHKLARCDGKGPVYVVSEGKHVFMNAIRHWFGMYTSKTYNIWADSQLVALAERVGGRGSQQQLIFRQPDKADTFASSFLADRHYHGTYDKWFVHEQTKVLPAWVVNAATALRAFPTSQAKQKAAAAAARTPKQLEAARALEAATGPPPPAQQQQQPLEEDQVRVALEVPPTSLGSPIVMAEVPPMAEVPVASAVGEANAEQHI